MKNWDAEPLHGVQFQSPLLLPALLISFLFGSAYSIELPLMRWKRHAFLVASCILNFPTGFALSLVICY
ncbi:unnamed protein product [Linum tenue]|uniref:Uncharacterized protein n=1 Tax=Linum tenue TaxID=586396 RepID=A0AAV0H238_9ROSI|nr:unnamed protein product [Linum tenue]